MSYSINESINDINFSDLRLLFTCWVVRSIVASLVRVYGSIIRPATGGRQLYITETEYIFSSSARVSGMKNQHTSTEEANNAFGTFLLRSTLCLAERKKESAILGSPTSFL